MRLKRTLPPAAAPIYPADIFNGILGMIRGKKERERFRTELKHHFNVKHCFLVSSGKAALYCILKALHEISPDKDEVLLPAFNCYSVPSAVVFAGLKVRLCDVDPDTLDFDFPKLARELINFNRLLCVVPTHLFGIPVDVARVKQLAGGRVSIVEDAAQALGSSKDGKQLGRSGDVGFFSLGRGKAFSTVEGGIIVTDNDEIGKRLTDIIGALPEYSLPQQLRLLFNAIILAFFTHPLLFWLPKGLPFLGIGETVFERSFPLRKLCSFQAGLTRDWETKLDCLMNGRETLAGQWTSFFRENQIPGICPLLDPSGPPKALLRFPVRVDDDSLRDRIIKKSECRGLGISETYPESLDKLSEIASQITGGYPQASKCARTILTLPVHSYMSTRDIRRIGKRLQSANEH